MLDTTRREFIALVGGGGLLLAAKVRRARAQQPAKIPRIGILDDAPMWQPFRQVLRELGYVEGQNIAYEYRYGEGAPDRLRRSRPSSFAARWTSLRPTARWRRMRPRKQRRPSPSS